MNATWNVKINVEFIQLYVFISVHWNLINHYVRFQYILCIGSWQYNQILYYVSLIYYGS